MSIKKKIFIIATVSLGITISSCKKYLDVNQNPNVSPTVTSELLLPTIEIYIATAMSLDMQTNGGIWAQYWTQNPNSSQYRDLEQYSPSTDGYNYPWGYLYNYAGENSSQLEKIATTENKTQYVAISLLLRAYIFQVATDAWGDVPFSEAFQGQREDGHVVSPKYDAQAEIYDGIIALIERATALIDPSDAITPGSDDLIYGGDMELWQKFANTLKLRVYIRLSQRDPGKAQAGIAALYAANAEFLDDGDDAQVQFSDISGNKAPAYTNGVAINQTQNLVASRTCIDSMNANNDYRLLVFYEPTNSGTFVGIKQGDYGTTVPPGAFSIPSVYIGYDAVDEVSASAAVKLLTGYESKFLQAEAVARGWAAGDAQQLFTDAITANFNAYAAAFTDMGEDVAADLADYLATAYWAQYPTGGSIQDQVRHIITQKWFSMCGNESFEAWTEWRRTGYPDFFVVSQNSLIGNNFPARFLYPNTEITRNSNFPGIKGVTEKVWWDVN